MRFWIPEVGIAAASLFERFFAVQPVEVIWSRRTTQIYSTNKSPWGTKKKPQKVLSTTKRSDFEQTQHISTGL